MNRETNIPLYRAEVEKIGKLAKCQIKPLVEINGKFYAIGFASLLDGEFWITTLNGFYYECKINTRSIHFEGMIANDSDRLLPNGEKDLRIFASLSEDGKGGDKVFYEDGLETFVIEFDFVSGVSMYEYLYDDEGKFSCKNFVKRFDCNSVFHDYKIVGIKQ